ALPGLRLPGEQGGDAGAVDAAGVDHDAGARGVREHTEHFGRPPCVLDPKLVARGPLDDEALDGLVRRRGEPVAALAEPDLERAAFGRAVGDRPTHGGISDLSLVPEAHAGEGARLRDGAHPAQAEHAVEHGGAPRRLLGDTAPLAADLDLGRIVTILGDPRADEAGAPSTVTTLELLPQGTRHEVRGGVGVTEPQHAHGLRAPPLPRRGERPPERSERTRGLLERPSLRIVPPLP